MRIMCGPPVRWSRGGDSRSERTDVAASWWWYGGGCRPRTPASGHQWRPEGVVGWTLVGAPKAGAEANAVTKPDTQ